MYTRQIPAEQYDLFKHNLEKNVVRDPMDVTYKCDINVNGIVYRLHLQLCNHRMIIPLQAVRLSKDIQKCELITSQIILGALTELILMQYGANDYINKTCS